MTYSRKETREGCRRPCLKPSAGVVRWFSLVCCDDAYIVGLRLNVACARLMKVDSGNKRDFRNDS